MREAGILQADLIGISESIEAFDWPISPAAAADN